MDKAIFVQNVKMYCDLRGVKPTVACKESGAGKDILNQIETRGSIPSIEKVEKLAEYLGCSVSDLLGEQKEDLIHSFYQSPPQDTIGEAIEVTGEMIPVVFNSLQSNFDSSAFPAGDGPYSIIVESKIQRPLLLPAKQKEPATVSSGGLDPLTAQLMDFVRQLTPEQKKFLLAQMKTMLDSQ